MIWSLIVKVDFVCEILHWSPSDRSRTHFRLTSSLILYEGNTLKLSRAVSKENKLNKYYLSAFTKLNWSYHRSIITSGMINEITWLPWLIIVLSSEAEIDNPEQCS